MPGFSKASISMGFNFWDDDEDDIPQDSKVIPPEPSMGYDDDLADAESNSDEEVSYVQGNRYDTPATALIPLKDDDPERLASATTSASTPAPNHAVSTPLDIVDAAFAQSATELEEYDSGASEAEVRRRADGQTFVKQRQITADLDMTDQMIVNLKNANHTNEHVTSELRKHGLVPYDSKTVGSRYIRLQKKIAEREAQRLEDELTDWHEGEDEALLRADELAQNEIKDVIQRAKNRRWQIVSRNLHKLLKKELKYNPKQCEKRFIELMDDRASIPVEMDDNPEERRAERAKRVLEKMNERALIEAREKTLKEQKRLAADQNALRIAMEKSKRAQERAHRAVKKAQNAQARALMQDHKHKTLEMKRQAEEARIISTSQKYAERHGLAYVVPLPHTPESTATNLESANGTNKTPPPEPISTIVKHKRRTMDSEVADSPRARLSVKELGDILSKRGLSKAGTKAEQIKRLAADDGALTPGMLRSKLGAYGVSTDGDRKQLVDRLVSCEVGAGAWGQKHADALGIHRAARVESQRGTKRAKVESGARDETDDENKEAGQPESGGTCTAVAAE